MRMILTMAVEIDDGRVSDLMRELKISRKADIASAIAKEFTHELVDSNDDVRFSLLNVKVEL